MSLGAKEQQDKEVVGKPPAAHPPEATVCVLPLSQKVPEGPQEGGTPAAHSIKPA